MIHRGIGWPRIWGIGNRLRLLDEDIHKNIKVRIQTIKKKTQDLSGKFDPATARILARMRNAKDLGAPENPEALRHSVLLEERMEEKLS